MATEQDEARSERVKELEAMVHKLTVENEKLMTRVHSPSTAQLPDEEKPSPTQHSSPGERVINNDEDTEEGVIALSDLDETGEDEWLFVSPMKPPTPKQKKVTPKEWLSGETSSRFSEKNLPSLNEVRKTLASSMDEAEQFVKSPKNDRKMQPSDKTAQKYLNKVRQKRQSPTGGSDGSSPRSLSPAEQSPLLSKKQRNVPIRPVIPHGSGKNSTEHSTQQASLKVKWTPPKSNADLEEDNVPVTNSLKVKWDPSKAVPSDDEEENEEELEELRAKWKVRVPVEDKEGETAKQVNPLKVNWTARVPDEGNEVEEKLEVKWKARMPVGDNEEEQVNPLKVKWTAQVPAEDYEDEEEEGDPVPVVKWKARMPVEDNEEETEKQVNPLKVNWTAQVPAEDYEEEEEEGDPVPVVKWKAKQVSEPEEEIPKTQWTVRNVGDPHQSRKQQRPSPDSSATQSLRGNLTPPSQRPKAVANPLKIQWDPSKASPASSEEDLSSQGSGESPQPQRVSRYSAHSKLAYPQTSPSPTASGLPGRRSARPVASVSPLQKGNPAVSPVQKRSSALRQPSPARAAGTAARLTPPQSQTNQAVRARSLSPDQGAQISSSNHKNPSTQSRLRSPGTASLGRRGGMKLMKPSGQTSATTRSTERSSIVPQQSSPNSRPQATKQLPSPQQHRITPPSSARSQGLQKPSSGIRQPSSLRRPAARGGTAQARPAKEKWLEDCF